jgi:2,5-diketo-D-gluconate reductase B
MEDIPLIGLGTWENEDKQTCIKSVKTALEVGYRHVDTAQYYENESWVGKGIAAADVPREDCTVATKVHTDLHGLAYDEVIEGAEASLDALGLEYLDILYVHWPVGNYDAAETLAAFDELRDRGRIEQIGVSNFSVEQVEQAREQLTSPLFALQVEMHPLLPQSELLAHAQDHDYYLVAYSPLARGRVFDVPEIQSIAEKHDVSEAQVSLAWLLSKDNVRVIPKASSEAHIQDNLEALNLDLSDDDLRRIDAIDERERLIERQGAPWLEEGANKS